MSKLTRVRHLKSALAKVMELIGDVAEAASDAVLEVTNNLNSHTENASNPHKVTKAQVGLGNVENKSSAAIRGELTKENVTTALGYTPPSKDTTYSITDNEIAEIYSELYPDS